MARLITGNFYALVAFALSAARADGDYVGVSARGGGDRQPDAGAICFPSTVLLIRRNTRRYGGYIVHIGVVIVVMGLAGSAFNRNVEKELALHDKMSHRPLHAGVRRLHPGFERQLRLRITRCWMFTRMAKSSSR